MSELMEKAKRFCKVAEVLETVNNLSGITFDFVYEEAIKTGEDVLAECAKLLLSSDNEDIKQKTRDRMNDVAHRMRVYKDIYMETRY